MRSSEEQRDSSYSALCLVGQVEKSTINHYSIWRMLFREWHRELWNCERDQKLSYGKCLIGIYCHCIKKYLQTSKLNKQQKSTHSVTSPSESEFLLRRHWGKIGTWTQSPSCWQVSIPWGLLVWEAQALLAWLEASLSFFPRGPFHTSTQNISSNFHQGQQARKGLQDRSQSIIVT